MDEPRWLDETEAAAWRGWVEMSEVLRARLNRELSRATGLSDADYAVLVNLSEAVDLRVRMSDLAGHLGWSKSRLSHQVGRMEGRGLVARCGCPGDARGAFAVLTPAGGAAIREAAPHHVASVRANFVDCLDHDQLLAVADVARTVLGRLRAEGGTCNGSGDDEAEPAADREAAPAGDCEAAPAASGPLSGRRG